MKNDVRPEEAKAPKLRDPEGPFPPRAGNERAEEAPKLRDPEGPFPPRAASAGSERAEEAREH
jgi:hypothetical protein